MAISAAEVHVWRADVEVGHARLEQLRKRLSPDELMRSETFRSDRDNRQFIAARGILRDILARYLNRTPAELRFGYTLRRKPFLTPDSGLRFNLSHSGKLALYAVALDREVGIDVERIEPDSSYDATAERLFSPQCVAGLRAMPAAHKARAFFELWTRHEAYLKARGEGFFTPKGHPCADSSTAEDELRWSMHPLQAGSDYAAAVVAEGTDWRPILFDWQPGR